MTLTETTLFEEPAVTKHECNRDIMILYNMTMLFNYITNILYR